MPHPDLLCRAIAAVDPSVSSLDEFQAISGIQTRSVARSVVEFLAGSGIGVISRSIVSFSGTDRMRAAMLCIQHGCDIQRVSAQISWKDFERLASEALNSYGYRTRTNVRFVKPRMEIDVVAEHSSLALAIDCKHWKHTNASSISEYSRKQAARAHRLVEKESRITRAIPLILTLHAESVRFVDRIPVVPIAQFRSFLEEVQAYVAEIRVMTRA
jgi:hypothetical protein